MSWGYEAEAGRTWIEKEYKKFMSEKWKVGDRVRLAGVEGRVDRVGCDHIGVFWGSKSEGYKTNSFYFVSPLFEKLERVAEPPKPLPFLSCFKPVQEAQHYQGVATCHISPFRLLEHLEADVAKLREYLGEAAPAPRKWKNFGDWVANRTQGGMAYGVCEAFAAGQECEPAPEKREIKWPTWSEFQEAWLHKSAPLDYPLFAVKWFREQIEGQL